MSHKEQALALLGGVGDIPSLSASNSSAQGLAALTHATLELAEQQRAAVTLAYFAQFGFNGLNPKHVAALGAIEASLGLR